LLLFGQEEKAAEQSEWITPKKQRKTKDCPADCEREQPSAYRYGFVRFSPEAPAQETCAVQAQSHGTCPTAKPTMPKERNKTGNESKAEDGLDYLSCQD
jgi:hypothetical protein